MEYEKVIDKVKKLQTLVERGERGEVLAAKRALDDYVLNIISISRLFLTKKRNGFLLNYLIMIN